jgi:uncharacterized protein YukE
MSKYEPLTNDDAFPGDAGAIQDYTVALQSSEAAATTVKSALKGVAEASQSTWVGDAADGFRAVAADTAQPLGDIATRLKETLSILGSYASALTAAQSSGHAYASQALDACNDRRWIQQQINTAKQSPTPELLTLNILQAQLNSHDNEFAHLQRKFEKLRADFEESASKTRSSLLELWDAHGSVDLSANGYTRAAKKPTLRSYPGSSNDLRFGTDSNGNRIVETTDNTTGRFPGGTGASRTTTTTTYGPGFLNGWTKDYGRQVDYDNSGKIPADDPKKSKARTVAGSTTATLASASSSAESFYGAEAKKQGKNFGGEAAAGARAKADANAKASITKDGLVASAGASASAKLEARASGSYKSEYVNGDVAAHVSVGAEASVKGKVGIGPNGVTAAVGGKAFVGGEAGLDGNIDLGGVGAGGHAGVTFGIGGQFDLKANVSLNDVSIKADLGATLGLGFHASVDIDIHPKEVIGNVGKAAGKVADFLGF